jgi:hypothetical protein
MSGGDYFGVSDGQTGVIPGQKSASRRSRLFSPKAHFRISSGLPTNRMELGAALRPQVGPLRQLDVIQTSRVRDPAVASLGNNACDGRERTRSGDPKY